MEEVLTNMAGFPQATDRNLNTFFQRLFKLVGVNVSDKALNEGINLQQSLWYGAGIGARVRPIVRNQTQPMWNLWTRIGGKPMGIGYEQALTKEGFNEAMENVAFIFKQRGVFWGEEAFFSELGSVGITGNNIAGRALAGTMTAALKFGRPAQKFSRWILKPFESSDIFNRVWCYLAQKAATRPWLEKFRADKITKEKFLTEGLAYYGRGEKKQFLKILARDGDEAALRYIGREAADLTNYVYMKAAQPLALQNQTGRIFGTFGTWPIWQKDLLMMTWRNATAAQRMKLAVRYSTLAGAIGLMSASWGVNLASWIAPTVPYSYGGGPGFQTALDMREIATSPYAWKLRGVKRMIGNWARLSFPGQLAVSNFTDALGHGVEEGNPWAALAALALGRPMNPDSHPYLETTHMIDLLPTDAQVDTGINPSPGAPLTPEALGAEQLSDSSKVINHRLQTARSLRFPDSIRRREQ